jgi:peptidyl-prolyl cis-trans isomerase C
VITVNGRVISDDEIAREVQYHPAATLDEARHEAALALVIRELLLQEAAALGVEPEPDPRPGIEAHEQVINKLLERELRLPEMDEEACRRTYEANVERFRSPDIFEASHILFAAPPGDEQGREAARVAAEKTLEELARDPGAFERLAAERSADTATAPEGGRLGQITRGQTTSEIERCLYELQPGQTSPTPVATRFGYHVVRLDRARRGRVLPYDMARERVADYLAEHAWRLAVTQYIKILAGKASIEGISLEGASTPLVQ